VTTKAMRPRAFGLALCLATSVLIGVMQVALHADCDCTNQGQCAAGTCCFVHNDCMVTKHKCIVNGSPGSYQCQASDSECTYSGPACGEPE
jgi:hypothetical protein